MHTPLHCLKLCLVILLPTFQACFFGKGSKKSLVQQVPSYTVSLRSENTTGYFEDQKIPIDILFSFENENIKNHDIGFRIKKISIEGVSGHLETETGDLLKDGCDFSYKGDGYPLFFVPEINEDSGHCDITLETLLIDKYGNETPDSTHKVASYQLYICHKQDVEETTQKEETKFSKSLKPLTSGNIFYKASNSQSHMASDMHDMAPSKIMDHQAEQGGSTGKFSPTIVIENNKPLPTTVPLEGNGDSFQDPGFFAKIACNKNISLTVGGKHLTGDEEWTLEDWYFKGLVTGRLYDVSNNHEITTPLKLQAGTIYISCRSAVRNISGSPIVVLIIIHPDGRKKEIQIDISSIVLPILEAKLNKYTTLLSDLIYTTTDLDIRDKTVKASKEIIVKMGYLLGKEDEEEKIKIESIIKAYDEFLKENQSLFEEAIRASKILYLANSAMRNSFVLEDKDKRPFWCAEDKKWITEFVNKVDKRPELFTHIPITIQTIRDHLDNINTSFSEEEEKKEEEEKEE